MRYLNFLGYVAIPLAFLVHFLMKDHSWEPTATFVLAALGVIPLAHLMGEATEGLSAKAGPTWGGLLNATFGNAAELIIAVIALHKGLNEIVKASLTGSIIGNLLLVGGAAMLAGGWKREKQTFSSHAAESNAGLLVIAVAAMLIPAIFHYSALQQHDREIVSHDHAISIGTSVVLLIVYALGLLFTLRTHAHVLSPAPKESHGAHESHGPVWSIKTSIIVLLLASAGVGIVAELLVGSAEALSQTLGWNHVFVGVILLAIVGNAAEHSTAIVMSLRDDMDTAMTITHQSSLQIALFATPFLVLLSAVMGMMHIGQAHQMDLLFTPMEVASVILAVGIVVVLGMNGETNWLEGALLLALYAILGIAFFYIPSETPTAGATGH